MKTQKMKLENNKNILTRTKMKNIIGGIMIEREPVTVHAAGTGGGSYPNNSNNSPMGAGTPYVNEQNELLYFAQAISNGISLVGSGVSWVKDNVKFGIGTFGQPTVTLY